MSENTHYYAIKANHYDTVRSALEKSGITAFFDPCENYSWHHSGPWETIPANKQWVAVLTVAPLDRLSGIFDVLAEIHEVSGQYWQVVFRFKGRQISVLVQKSGGSPELSPQDALEILSHAFSIPKEKIQEKMVSGEFPGFLELFGMPFLELVDQDIMSMPEDGVLDVRDL